jgi:hypothetical protein
MPNWQVAKWLAYTVIFLGCLILMALPTGAATGLLRGLRRAPATMWYSPGTTLGCTATIPGSKTSACCPLKQPLRSGHQGSGSPTARHHGHHSRILHPGQHILGRQGRFLGYEPLPRGAERAVAVPARTASATQRGADGQGTLRHHGPLRRPLCGRGHPITEYRDSAPTVRCPYELATVKVFDASSGALLAQSTPVIPISSEMHCGNSACHASPFQQNQPLYRQSTEHTGVYCEACHDSAHAVAPSREYNDSLKFVAWQGHNGPLDNCMVCHVTRPIV